ncbi:MAG: Ger(x)C family spore germination protein [Peptococcaceae bacterium]|nr:Ger(x)C family spore germination protein [Peptococcaceae bacterium]
MKTKRAVFLCIFLCVFLLCGCWNYRDLEDLNIMMGAAIDKNQENGEYKLTIEIINQAQSGGQSGGEGGQEEPKSPKSFLIEAEGHTVFDAVRNAVRQTGKRLFWGHCKGIIISQEIAREGILTILDLFWRDAEIRPDIWIAVAGNAEAGDILKAKTESGDPVSVILDNTLDAGESVSTFVKDELTPFVEKLSVKTNSVVAPAVYIKNEEGEPSPEIKGTAVFKEDKLKYFLDEEESQTALLLMNQLKGGVLTLEENSTSQPSEKMRISLEIYGSNVKIDPSFINGELTMEIEAQLEAGVSELAGSENYLDKEKRKELEKNIESILTNRILDLVAKTQGLYSSDIFGFNNKVKRKMPDYWRSQEKNWDDIYRDLRIAPQVKVDLTLSSNTSKPITIGQ